jgi:hypothetical protein
MDSLVRDLARASVINAQARTEYVKRTGRGIACTRPSSAGMGAWTEAKNVQGR